MRRREFIAGLGVAAAWPVVARAQQAAVPTVGLLGTGNPDTSRNTIAAFHRGLGDVGYVEGRNLAIEYRFADFHLDRFPALAAELVQRKVDVIVVFATPPLFAAKAATDSIPIVFQMGVDPVAVGLVASLNHPGGNLTGVYNLLAGVTAKRLALLHEAAPSATLIAHLVNPTNTTFADAETRELQGAARILGVRLVSLNVSYPSEFESAYAIAARERVGAVLVGGDSLFLNYPNELTTLAARHTLPAIYPMRDHTVAGGLLSYSTDYFDAWRQVGVYAGRIVRGEKAADLPVQQVTKLQLVINLKTANALALTIPETLLATADEVIQ
jgi:putative ABC transport system substrate-binding protein